MSNQTINKVTPTNEQLTGRGGLNLFVKYLMNIHIFTNMLIPFFGKLRKSKKGISVQELFKQVFAFFLDGTSRHLAYFDQVKEDPAYASVIETKEEQMASSHSMKRFFQAFTWPLIFLFRHLHLKLFVWRLRANQPVVIPLYIDAMVMDNDDAPKREEVSPTYKKCKGFNALQLTWEGHLADTILRPGKFHSNSGHSVEKMVRRVVKIIREQYSTDVPIIFRMDSGFLVPSDKISMDQKLYRVFEELGVGYIASGKLFEDITSLIAKVPDQAWDRYFGPGDPEDNRIWEYVEFGDRRQNWDKFRRAIFTRPMNEEENGQLLLPLVRPCTVLYTNLGMGYTVDSQLREAGLEWLLSAEGVINCSHDSGRSELTFKSFKEFGSEKLPFQKYKPNVAFYHCMVLAFNLYQAFKEDVCSEVVPESSYPTTLRRKVIDIGGKIVKTSHQIILRISKPIFDVLNFNELWRRCCAPPHVV